MKWTTEHKITFLVVIVVIVVLSVCCVYLTAKAPQPSERLPAIYVTIILHNEDGLEEGRPDYTENLSYYLQNRQLVKLLAETVIDKGATFNFQSDWNYLLAVAKFDNGAATNNTAGKNIVRWMHENLGAEVDPHSHERGGYNYADVAYLTEQLGVTPTKTVGGFQYYPPNNYQGWEKHENGLWGENYPSYFWRGDILWGASGDGHKHDDNSSGIWRPKDRYDFYEHDGNQRLVYIGGFLNNTAGVTKLLDDISSGKAPKDGFYTATIMMIQDFMDNSSIAELGNFIDSLKPYVDEGRVRWATLSEMVNLWKTEYESQPFHYISEG